MDSGELGLSQHVGVCSLVTLASIDCSLVTQASVIDCSLATQASVDT